MSAATEKDLFLLELRAENYKRFTCFLLNPEGKHAIIRAKNGRGKSSAVQALETLICGANSKAVPEPIRKGESKAVISADLGDIVIKRTITDKGQTLEVRAADGSKINRPQQLLDELRGGAFDLIGFMDARPQDQVDAVLSVCKVAPPVEAVRELTGEDYQARPGESADAYMGRLSADDIGLFFVRRRDAGRIADQKRKALAEQSALVEQLGGAVQAGEDYTATGLLERITALQSQADAKRAAETLAGDAEREYEQAVSRLKSLEEGIAIEDKRVADLESQLAAAKERRRALADRIETGKGVVAELLADARQREAEANQLPNVQPEITSLRSKIAEAERSQTAILKRQGAVEQENRLAVEANEAEVEHMRLEALLNRLRHIRAHLLDDIDLGIDGLEVGHGELRLNGLSLRSASTAETLTVAVAVATRQESRLKVLWIDQGERLDAAHRSLLLRLATEAGWQVVLTAVSEDDEPRVEIVEGDAA